MKGIAPLILIVGTLALVLIFFNRPGSILDDCSRIPFIGAHTQYAPVIESYSPNIWGNTQLGDEGHALVIDNVPNNVEIESAQTKVTFIKWTSYPANEMWIGTTWYRDMSYGRCPAQKAYILSAGGEVISRTDKRIEGYYDVWYVVKFREITPTPTPIPSRSVLPIPTQQEDRTPILSDIFDSIKSVIAGIIAFIAIPFIPPAP